MQPKKLLIQLVLVIGVSPRLCSVEAGPERSFSHCRFVRRRRVFRQGQQKSKELSWGDPFCLEVTLTSFLCSTKPECHSLRILISFPWHTSVGLFSVSGVQWRCVTLAAQLCSGAVCRVPVLW